MLLTGNASGISIRRNFEATSFTSQQSEKLAIKLIKSTRRQEIDGSLTSFALTGVRRTQQRHRLPEKICDLYLLDGGKTVNRFRRQHARAVEEKLMKAAIANLRLAEVRGE